MLYEIKVKKMILFNNEWIPCASFNYDGTLTDPRVYNFFVWLREKGVKIKITTSRMEKGNNEDLYKFCEENVITKSEVKFTNRDYKYKSLIFDTDIDIHLDNDIVEIRKLNNTRSFIVPIYTKLSRWEITACRALKLSDEEMAVYYFDNKLPWCGEQY